MSDLGDRRRKARTESAQRSSERHSAKLSLRDEAFGIAAAGDDDLPDFDLLEWFKDTPRPRGME